jgi:hypothetical protein
VGKSVIDPVKILLLKWDEIKVGCGKSILQAVEEPASKWSFVKGYLSPCGYAALG